jgi:DNA-binding NarL/FixJ family response regulator
MTSPIRKIMIIDDHDAIRRGVRQLLETTPYYQVVAEAADGRTALELAKETRPDIAIVDYSIPEMNGLDLSHALKKELPRIEILLYTMHDREDIILEVLRAGVRGFVLKSDTERHLIAALDSLSIRRPYFSGAVSDTLLEQFLENKPHTLASSLTHREREVVQQVAEGRYRPPLAGVVIVVVLVGVVRVRLRLGLVERPAAELRVGRRHGPHDQRGGANPGEPGSEGCRHG